jgi:tetratricopeptide (TPR) repeat protein
VARCLLNLASLRQDLGRAPEAEPLLVRALEMTQRLFQGDHADVARCLNNLGTLRRALGRPAEAETLFVQSLEMIQRIYPGDHVDVARSLSNLANVRLERGRAAEAETLFLQALEMHQRLYTGDHALVAGGLSNLARAHHALGKSAEARRELDTAIAMLRRLSPKGSVLLSWVLWHSASIRMADDAAAALPELEEAMAMDTPNSRSSRTRSRSAALPWASRPIDDVGSPWSLDAVPTVALGRPVASRAQRASRLRSSSSQARVNVQLRFTVLGEISSAEAISSMLSPE